MPQFQSSEKHNTEAVNIRGLAMRVSEEERQMKYLSLLQDRV
jgi:hypothetical protein